MLMQISLNHNKEISVLKDLPVKCCWLSASIKHIYMRVHLPRSCQFDQIPDFTGRKALHGSFTYQ